MFALSLACALDAGAAVVHVVERTVAGGAATVLSDKTVDTGTIYSTTNAPELAGYLFTQWTTDAHQAIADRDAWGRALDAASFMVYENTTLTAEYLPESEDSDSDGMPDGHEIYWYGDLDETPEGDTDGDGLSFAAEIRRGSNPLFPDRWAPGPVIWGDSGTVLYNPNQWAPYIIRSEPEGRLFETITAHAEPGTVITTESYDPETSVFAEWRVNGQRMQDAWGRALDAATFTATATEVTEAVAWCVDDEIERQSTYWYGHSAMSADSDTDGDGYTLAQEIARGSNPLFPDRYAPGPVLWEDSSVVQYNPHGYAPYVIRSEPEGALFETISDYLLPGATVDTPSLDPGTSAFSGWLLNGVRQADAWGRALDQLTLVGAGTEPLEAVALTEADEMARQGAYWYGDAAMSADSDTDGDGYTLAQEIARGSNPLFPDRWAPGPVVWADSATLEANLQPFEQLRTALVEGAAEEVFTSPIAHNEEDSWTFGADLSPAVADLDGDGLFDLVLASVEGVRVFRNTGSVASPDFTEIDDPFGGLAGAFLSAAAGHRVIAGGEGGVYLAGEPIRFFPADGSEPSDAPLSGVPAFFGGELYALAPAAGSVATTNGALSLDTPVIGGLSLAVADATQDGRPDLLVSDDEGRVWLYRGNADGSFTLLHKVWGGTFGGFAEGLKIAALDWDDDGDLDALGGTAAGRLMLLRDPRIGRPANLRLVAGLNSVVLSWEPNAQSRVRGYRVYRASGPVADAGSASFERLTTPWTPLPTYRDLPPHIRDWLYRVTTVSRFYTAGNSTPTETESAPSDVLQATLGSVALTVRDAAGFAGEEIEVAVSANNSLGLAADGLELAFEFDSDMLSPVAPVPSGLGSDLVLDSDTATDGFWTISATGGEVVAGEGTLLLLRFRAADSAEGDTPVTLVSATLRATSGQTATAPTPVSGTVSLQLRNPPEPAYVAVALPSCTAEAGGSFALPISIETTKPLDAASVALSVSYDPALLTPVSAELPGGGAPGAATFGGGVWTLSGFPADTIPAGSNDLIALQWAAASVEADATSEITLSTLDILDMEGLAAETTVPAATMVAIQAAGEGGGGEGGGWEDDPDAPDEGEEGVDWSWSRTGILFSVPNATVRAGDTFDLPLETRLFPLGFFSPRRAADGARFRVSISYDPSVLEPVEVVVPSRSPLAVSNSFGEGRWRVSGTGGTIPFGDSQPLVFRFRAIEQYGFNRSEIDFRTARAFDVAGDRMPCWKHTRPCVVTVRFVRPPDDPCVVAPWSKGDVDGNGRLERADLERLRVLLDYAGHSGHGGNGNGHGGPGQHAPVATERELHAGDMNGNGKLEEGDYQLLYKFLKEKGAIR